MNKLLNQNVIKLFKFHNKKFIYIINFILIFRKFISKIRIIELNNSFILQENYFNKNYNLRSNL